jgi:membrane-bound serine protease (ClpP class)
VIVQKTTQAANARPTHDLEILIGAKGEAKSDIQDEGSVYVNGEMWSAKSDSPISNGSTIQVVRREGVILVVEKIK